MAKEPHMQQKIEELDSFTFDLDGELRDADRKRRAAHKHAKHFKQLAHMRIKRSKEILKRSNVLGELNTELKDEAGSLIKVLTAQEKYWKDTAWIFHSQNRSPETWIENGLSENRVVPHSGRLG